MSTRSVESLRGTLRTAQLKARNDTNPTWDEFEQALAVVNRTEAQLAWAESELALLRSQHEPCGGAATAPPGPPDPPSRHLWGLAGPQGNMSQGDPTKLPEYVVTAVWSLSDRQQLILFRRLARHLVRGLTREEIVEALGEALNRG